MFQDEILLNDESELKPKMENLKFYWGLNNEKNIRLHHNFPKGIEENKTIRKRT